MDRMMNQMMGNMFNDPFNMNPFGMRGPGRSPFGGMPMMPMMNTAAMSMSNMSNRPGTFVSSSIVSISNDGINGPQVYEQTHSNRMGPGGVREEKRTVRDSRTGLQKMSIGRHIYDRGHVIERSQNRYTGDEEENNEYINIEEEEAPQFNQEWTSRVGNHSSQRHIHTLQREPVLAITGPEEPSANSSYPTASTSGNRNSADKKLRIKPMSMKKDKKVKKPYRKE